MPSLNAVLLSVVATFSVAAAPFVGRGHGVMATQPKDTKMAPVRKQVYNLTPADLQEFPVWEFALDEEGVEGQDEATVRPRPAAHALNPDPGMLVVRASFQLADGTRMSGYLTPPIGAERELGTTQPVIVGSFGQVSFWKGIIRPEPSDLAKIYERLGKSASQVFPLKFQSEVQLRGGPVSGTIPGFLVIRSFDDRHNPEVLK